MKKILLLILPAMLFRCGCTYYFDYTYSVCFINNLNEEVLIKDEGFSRGVIPFFVPARF